MPVTTRAAALRSKSNGNEITSVKQTTPPQAPGGTVRQHHSQQQQQTQAEEQLSPNCTNSESCVTSPQQSTVSQAVSVIDVDSHRDQADGKQKSDMDVSLESLFCDQEVILSTTEIGGNVSPMSSSFLSNQDDDLNATTSTPVVQGDITLGTSTRGGKMIFMNLYGYIHMNETKETIGWRCVKRNENCKAVIYTIKSTGDFSHWNGQFHSHSIDMSDTRKREILSKIKGRVLDEFIPIKVIIEEEYRKA